MPHEEALAEVPYPARRTSKTYSCEKLRSALVFRAGRDII